MAGVIVTKEPKIEPLKNNIRVISWKIINELKGIRGYQDKIEFDIMVEVNLSDGTSRNYQWQGILPRRSPLFARYQKDKDVSVIYQWVRPRLLKNGLYRGRKKQNK